MIEVLYSLKGDLCITPCLIRKRIKVNSYTCKICRHRRLNNTVHKIVICDDDFKYYQKSAYNPAFWDKFEK